MYQPTEPNRIFLKSFISSIFILCFGIYMFSRSGKQKSDFEYVTGQIDFISQSFQDLNTDDGKHRYIHLTDYPVVFELFIGNDTGDFSPKFEQLDKLKVGDQISIYTADPVPFQKGEDSPLNKTVQFIDKAGEAYFIRGNKDKYGGYFFVGMGTLLALTLVILRQTGKIV